MSYLQYFSHSQERRGEEDRLQLAFLITCKTFKAQVTVSILALSSSYEANSPLSLEPYWQTPIMSEVQ